ncbi:hypothetical protein [Halomonas borealis]|uniref:hypothetical protein n=1 Tax=Halomonas borealis TaxID=2508710 RepID=UPI00109FC184|nr:hypothetical protein [Halomonas borealis]
MSMKSINDASSGRIRGINRWWMAFLLSGTLLPVAAVTSASTLSSGILSAGTHDIYYQGYVIPDEGLEELRGGFKLSGLELNFGAKLTTMINDKVRYITQVAFDNAGSRVLSSTLEASGVGAGAEIAVRSEPGSGSITSIRPEATGTSRQSNNSSLDAASTPGKLNLAGLSDFSGVLFSGKDGGMTAALHKVTRDAIVSSLSTTASGQSISNDIDVSVHVMNIGEVKASRQRAMILNSLQGIPR